MRSSRSRSAALIGLALFLSVGSARAQDAADPDKLFAEAMTLIGEERYTDAIPKLEEAQRIDPGIGTQFNLALCYAKTGRLSLAWKNFSQVELLAGAAGKKDRAEAARAQLDELRPRLPSASVRLDEPGGTVSIDGEFVPAADLGFIPLDPGEHRIEVSAHGKRPYEETLVIVGTEGERHQVIVPLLQPLDTNTEVRAVAANAEPSARLSLELDAALPFAALLGGDVTTSCSGTCSTSLAVGMHAVLHAIYQSPSGFGGGLDVGYLVAWRTLEGRMESLQPLGNLPANPGTVEDKLRLSGLTAGASAQYRRGANWPWLLRLGAGVFLGDVRDDRTGALTNSKGELYRVSPQRSAGATYVYFAPEVRIGRRLGPHFEVNIGVEMLLLAALSQPKWTDDSRILTTNTPGAQGDGLGTFGNDTLLGSFVVLIAPGVGARFEF